MNFGTNNQCRGYLVGGLNQGIAHMFQMMNSARIEVGVQGLAQGAAAYMAALDYARERTQGSIKDEGGVRSAKIVEHPDVQRMLANMKALVEGGRALLYHLTLYIDLADHHPTQSDRYQDYVDLLTPICKTYGSDQGFRVTELAIQTLGGYGYCNEYGVEQYMRDVKITSIYEGTNGIQALDLVFRKIIGSKGALLNTWLDEVQEFCTSLDQTDLDPIGQTIQQVANELAQTAQHLAANMDQAQYYAVAFQEAMSLLAAAYYLARQAQVASAKAANSNDAFYAEKIVTAMMFRPGDPTQSWVQPGADTSNRTDWHGFILSVTGSAGGVTYTRKATPIRLFTRAKRPIPAVATATQLPIPLCPSPKDLLESSDFEHRSGTT